MKFCMYSFLHPLIPFDVSSLLVLKISYIMIAHHAGYPQISRWDYETTLWNDIASPAFPISPTLLASVLYTHVIAHQVSASTDGSGLQLQVL